MKHGPIALLDEGTPVVIVATGSHVYGKLLSNIQEVRARAAAVIAIASDGNEAIQHLVDDVIFVPTQTPTYSQFWQSFRCSSLPIMSRACTTSTSTSPGISLRP
jgi:glucosamine 6-phosphate synthetase-like amidotransferase/phosphosugar isomerase protein